VKKIVPSGVFSGISIEKYHENPALEIMPVLL
jgi:hypothetical protein